MTFPTNFSVSAPASAQANYSDYPDYPGDEGGGFQQKVIAIMYKIAKLMTDQGNARIKNMSEAADKVRNDQVLANQVASIIAGIKGNDDKVPLPDDLINSIRNSNISFTWQGGDGKTHTGNIDDYLNSVRGPIQYPTKPEGYIDGTTLEQVNDKLLEMVGSNGWRSRDYEQYKNSYDYDQAMAEANKKASGPVPLNKGQLDLIKSAIDTAVQRGTDMQPTEQLKLQSNIQQYNVLMADVNSLNTMIAEMLKSIATNIR